MTKQELIEQFAKESRMAFQDAKEIVNTIFNEMALRLKNNERVELRGFGSFNVKSYEGYNGRNPRTGESVYVRPQENALLPGRQRTQGQGEQRVCRFMKTGFKGGPVLDTLSEQWKRGFL